ncbi:hypothetical protein ACFQT0_30670 [Hymenobacter humi]|uniref:Aminotransferase class I/II-fold pyridoxal phosphate-dependent enzyme n=1 Tax=Hymenobacter humi TaxID=1411620 RepID=A0ABW2UCR0_9BACT
MQATAAAVQVNNINLIRGLIGSPGNAILQMNGQPTSQNTRECGADGDLPGFRNWDNPDHIRELARLWNVHEDKIPHWAPPTHAMQIWRYCETGSIKLLWIQATNPAVSLPELARIRKILEKKDLLVVVEDAFMTETAQPGRRGAARRHLGRKPAPSPTPTARCTCPTRPLSRPGRPAPISTSCWTMPTAWISAIRTGSRSSSGARRKRHLRPGRCAARAAPATIRA